MLNECDQPTPTVIKIIVFPCIPSVLLPLSVDLVYIVDWICIISGSPVKKDIDGCSGLRLCRRMSVGDMMTRNRVRIREIKYLRESGSTDQSIRGHTGLHCPAPGPRTC